MFLGLIFFLELTAGILAFVFKDWIKDQLNFFINNNVKAYRDDIDLQNLIDFTQEYVSSTICYRVNSNMSVVLDVMSCTFNWTVLAACLVPLTVLYWQHVSYL